MEQTPELKPCPFCGGEEVTSEGRVESSRGQEFCFCCGASGPHPAYDELTPQPTWNTRVALKVSDTMIEDIISEVYDLYNQAGNHWISNGALEEMSRRILSALEGNNNND